MPSYAHSKAESPNLAPKLESSDSAIASASITTPSRGLLYEEEAGKHRGFMVSNEVMLFRVDPILQKNADAGAIISIGFDRGLDRLINVPQLSHLYMVDCERINSITSFMLLEIGAIHHAEKGKFNSVNEYLEYFKVENIESTINKFSGLLSDKDLQLIRESLASTFSEEYAESEPNQIQEYLRFKANQTLYPSWLSNPDNLNSIIERWIAGDIQIVCGDMAGGPGIDAIARDLQEKQVKLSVVDSSNINLFLTPTAIDNFYHSFGIKDPERCGFKFDPEKLIFLSSNNSADDGPRVPAHLEKESPAIFSLGASNSWGFYLTQFNAYSRSVNEFPNEALSLHFITILTDLQRTNATRHNEVWLIGDFNIADHNIESWGINSQAFKKDVKLAFAEKYLDPSLSNKEYGVIKEFIQQEIKHGYSLKGLREVCWDIAFKIADSPRTERSHLELAIRYAELAILASEKYPNSARTILLLTKLVAANENDRAYELLPASAVQEYISWDRKPLPTDRVRETPAISLRGLTKDPLTVMNKKNGGLFTEDEQQVLSNFLSSSAIPEETKREIENECLFKACILARIGSMSLFDLKKNFYERAPNLEEVNSIVRYVDVALQDNHLDPEKASRLLQICAALKIAEYKDQSIYILDRLGKILLGGKAETPISPLLSKISFHSRSDLSS